MTTLQEAINELHRLAVVQRRATSTKRLDALADYCTAELSSRGLAGVEKEARVPGAGREKLWDVAWRHTGKYRLGISLKSILRNLGGTVPNRIDDLIGETANAQLHSPEIVVGYIVVFNRQTDVVSTRHGSTWGALLHRRLSSLSGRRAPVWSTGMLEDFLVVDVNFGKSAEIVSMSQPPGQFFDRLVEQVKLRNPEAIDGNPLPMHHAQTKSPVRAE